MGWTLALLVAVGGALGSLLRWSVGVAALRWLGAGFPYGTLIVNVAGSFLMGIAFAVIAARLDLQGEWRALAMTGFLGGFTTFSAFSLDVVLLGNRGEWLAAALYVVASVALSILALLLGLWLCRSIGGERPHEMTGYAGRRQHCAPIGQKSMRQRPGTAGCWRHRPGSEYGWADRPTTRPKSAKAPVRRGDGRRRRSGNRCRCRRHRAGRSTRAARSSTRPGRRTGRATSL